MNLGARDRIMRLIGGLTFAIVDFFSNAEGEVILLAIGVWGVLTSALGYCPFYGVTGVSTCQYKVEEVSEVSD